jgi:hypothetical protein
MSNNLGTEPYKTGLSAQIRKPSIIDPSLWIDAQIGLPHPSQPGNQCSQINWIDMRWLGLAGGFRASMVYW